MAFRFDRGSLRPVRRLDDGRIRADAYISRTGVFIYVDAKGKIRREYRPPEEVFHEDSLDSYALVPVTDEHPNEKVTSRNASKYARGSLGETVVRDLENDHVKSALTVFDEILIKKIESGKVELSSGYSMEPDYTPGVSPEGEHYDLIQRKIRGNHVAVVTAGRAGKTVSIRMDGKSFIDDDDDSAYMRMDSLSCEDGEMPSVDTIVQGLQSIFSRQGERTMAGTDDLPKLAEALTQVSTLTIKVDSLEKSLVEANKTRDAEKLRADKAEAERDTLKETSEKLVKDHAEEIKAIPGKLRARMAIEAQAVSVMGKDYKTDGLTDRKVKEDIVKKLTNKDIASDKSDDYVDFRYDSVMESREETQNATDHVRAHSSGGTRTDVSGKDPELVAREERLKKGRDAWKTQSFVKKGA